MKSKRTKIKELPAPYDLKAEFKECQEEGYATKYGIAWIEGKKLQHREQERGKTVSDIPAPAFIRCIRIHKGAGWFIAKRPDVASKLYDHTPAAALPPAPFVSRLVLSNWLEERHQELETWINDACEKDSILANLWRDKHEEIKAGNCRQICSEHPTQSHLLLSLNLAFQSLDAMELAMDYGERKDAKLKSNDGDAFFISAMKSGYKAGRRLHELKAELASIKAMKMASQTSSGKKQSQRTEWLAVQINELEKELGRKARTLEIISYIKGKPDPISGAKIYHGILDGDEAKVIEWCAGEVMTVKNFADKISHIRKNRK
jgi:hypothetical protein